MKLFKFFIFFILATIIISSSIAITDNSNTKKRIFKGNATLKIIEKPEIRIAVCTPNEKYLMEPGSTIRVRLYNRNDMANYSINYLLLNIPKFEGFTINSSAEYIKDIPAGEYKYFDIYITADEDLKFGDYELRFFIGTNEHEMGSWDDVILIRVRPYGNEMPYILSVIIILILILVIYKYFWIYNKNKIYEKSLNEKSTRKKGKKKKSFYYYKKNKTKN
jgi:uncharacterized membrane protein